MQELVFFSPSQKAGVEPQPLCNSRAARTITRCACLSGVLLSEVIDRCTVGKDSSRKKPLSYLGERDHSGLRFALGGGQWVHRREVEGA